MASSGGKTSRPGIAMRVGFIATLIVLVAWAAGLTQRAELAALDFRFRHMSRHRPTGQVLHVDIDDRSLERVGRWPWPRATLAGVIDTLHECGARLVVLDIVFPEPQEVRFVDETAELYAGPLGETVGHASPTPVYDDAIFADTVSSTRTIVPMFITSEANHEPLPPLVTDMLRLLRPQPDASFEAVTNALTQVDASSRAELAAAYMRARAILAISRLALPDDAVGTLDVPSGGLIAPVASLAAATHTTGFVSFEPDLDGVLRHMPMLARADDRVYPQLALVAAADELPPPGHHATIRAAGKDVSLTADEFHREIPVNSTSRLLINWPNRNVYKRWLADQHISAAGVAEIGRMRSAIRRNTALKRLTQLTLAKGRSDEIVDLFRQADALAVQRRQAARQRYMAMLYDPATVPSPATELQKAEQDVERRIDDAFAAFRRDDLEGFYLAAVPEDPRARKEYDFLKGLLDRIDRIDRENEGKEKFIATHQARLRSRVAGKVCLIGSTAAAAADFVPTPLGVRMPGVQVHGWIFETIAADRYVSPAPAWLNGLVIVVCGLLLAAVAANRPVPFTALAAVALAVGFAGLNASVIFAFGGVWLDLVAPLAAMVASLLAVTGFRQLTEERAKRQIRDMFSHALSPVLVDRLMEDPEMLRLGGQQRSITSIFSDLAGFTPMSERLGPEATVRLLNRYFDRVTDVIQNRGGGYLNKFLGDGIFCFFGAPVMQDDHPLRAIRAAVECSREVRRLNASGEAGVPDDIKLSIRVGVATGEAMVGNCGSTQRMDYTAIGDSVNLAARLEAANKYFGTEILVAKATWQAAETDGLLARSLGKVLVTGQSASVAIWHVLGDQDDFDEDRREAVAGFNRGMEAFAERRFQEAIDTWQGVRTRWPDDRATDIFIAVAEHCLTEADLDPTGYATQSGKGVDRIVWPWT